MLITAKTTYDNGIAEKIRQEEERIAKEKKEAEDKERIRLENERLKSEAENAQREAAKLKAKAEIERKTLEGKAKKDKEALEAKLKAEKEAIKKLEAELKVATSGQVNIQIDGQKIKKQSDKAILKELVKQINDFRLPETKSPEAKMIVSQVKILLDKISNFIQEKTNQL